MHGLIPWFAKNDVAANILMAIIILSGLYVLSNKIPVDMFPEFETNTVSVSMSLRGASPQEVEEGLTIRIEEAIQDLNGIERINSTAREGGTTVNIEVEDGYDVKDVLDEVKIRVDAINNFPVDTQRRGVVSANLAASRAKRTYRGGTVISLRRERPGHATGVV